VDTGSSSHGAVGESVQVHYDGEEADMSKRARKRRDRGKKSANHGKKPNT